MNHASKQQVLLVEDEKEIADTLIYSLSSEGYQPIWAASAEGALEMLSNSDVALCILDIGLPDTNGFELFKSIRQLANNNADVPCMFLTARSEEIDRIVGLEIGADDYVCKPFSPREVVARVKVILRRVEKQHSPSQVKTTPTTEFTHKPEYRRIDYAETSLDLTRSEYQLMSAFLAQPGRVFSRRQLIEQIWSSNHPSDDRAIDTHIKTLRAKLKPHNPHKEFIVTHRGFGYSLEL